MTAAIMDAIIEGIPSSAVRDLCVIAETPSQFFFGMQAMVELGDIIKDHYSNKEPDDGTFDEIENLWGTEGDDFDPPEDWFDEGGPFGPEDPDL